MPERALLHTELLHPQVAVSIDARNLPSQLKRFPELLEEVRARHIQCDVLYLDADDETLLKRFSETRRRHPLTNESRSLAEAIRDEELLLAAIIDHADLKIDTTHLNLYQLRDMLKLRLLNKPEPGTAFHRIVRIQARHAGRCRPGIRRALPAQPVLEGRIARFSGLDQPVIDYLAVQPDVEEMFQDIHAYLSKWLPRFAASNRAYVTIAIGCTGGHHRSVYLAERLGLALKGAAEEPAGPSPGSRLGIRKPMPAREVTIINKLGLHARAAAKFVAVANRFLQDPGGPLSRHAGRWQEHHGRHDAGCQQRALRCICMPMASRKKKPSTPSWR